jgi:uncharacterized protein YcaQ
MARQVGVDLTVSATQARRFLLQHQRLLAPRSLAGKQGALDYVRFVNCIQYDPINVVGQNPHLVLQARVRNYKPAMLNDLLYKDRSLLDGFDKVMSIYPSEDWPFFASYRAYMDKVYTKHPSNKQAAKLIDWVAAEIKKRGPLSSLELEDETRMPGWWGGTSRAARIALDLMFVGGQVVVHHRVGTRRYFDLADRTLNKSTPKRDPLALPNAYRDWHVHRRIGSLGLARPAHSNQWAGILRKLGGTHNAALARLVGRGEILRIGIDSLPGQLYYIRESDLPAMQAAAKAPRSKAGAAFLAPLDNLLWDRDLLEELFDFFYRWEVYVPEKKRVYGYYVLPVLYGDQFVARMDPAYDKAARTFTIKNWWWQKGVNKKGADMLVAMQECIAAFAKYLGAEKIALGEKAKKDAGLKAAALQALR